MSAARHDQPRRWVILVVIVAVLAGLGIAAHSAKSTPAIGLPRAPGAIVSPTGAESSAWYCAGQTTAAGQVAVGSVDLTNTGTKAVSGTITSVTDRGATVTASVSVPARGQLSDGPSGSAGVWAARTVVLSGGGVAVTQLVHGPSGWAEAPCLSSTSQYWYFPSGQTSGSDSLYLALFNPTSTPDVVDLRFVTPKGVFHPISFQGIVLRPQETEVEDVGTYIQNEPSVATVVTTRTGRVVASETQVFSGSVSGLANVPGSPHPETKWSIPQAEEVEGGATSIDIFNPGTTTEDVTVRSRLVSGPLPPFQAHVFPDSVWQLVTSAQTRIPKFNQGNGGYSTLITATGGTGVVVSRSVSAPSGAAAPQAGLSDAVDALSATSPVHEWVVPSALTARGSGAPAARPTDVALTNPTGRTETYAVYAMSASGLHLVTKGRLPPSTFISLSGKPLAAVANDPLLVTASGSVAIGENVGPSGVYGVVTMNGIPLAAAINR